MPSSISGLKLKLLPHVMSRLAGLPVPLGSAIKRKLAPYAAIFVPHAPIKLIVSQRSKRTISGGVHESTIRPMPLPRQRHAFVPPDVNTSGGAAAWATGIN